MSNDLDFIKELGDNKFSIDNRSAVNKNLEFISKLPKTNVGNSTKFKLVIDCDEVIVDICDKWLYKFSQDKYLSDKYMTPDLQVMVDKKLANFRLHTYITDLLKITDKDDVERLISLYRDDVTFYDDLVPTRYMRSLNSIMDYVESIDILSKKPTDGNITSPCDISKKKFLLKYLKPLKNINDIKLNIHLIDYHDSKAKYINDNDIKFTSIVDDNPYNVIDIVKNVKEYGYEILAPLTGYNVLLPKMLQETNLVHENRLTFNQFNNFESSVVQEKDVETIMRSLFKVKNENNIV